MFGQNDEVIKQNIFGKNDEVVNVNKQPAVEQDFLTPLLAGGAAAAAGYGISKPVKLGLSAIGKSFSTLPTEKQAKFAKKIEDTFIQQHTNKINEFGGKLDALAAKNPDKTISLGELASEINSNPDISPEARNIFRKTPVLKEALTRPDLAENITLREAQDIINHLNKKVSPMNKFDVTEAINSVKAAQLDAFPEMAGVRQSYKEFIQPYKNVKKYLGFNKTIPSIENRFGGAEGQMAIKNIMPPKVYEEMLAFRRAPSLERIAGKIGKTVLGKGMGGFLSTVPYLSAGIPSAGIAVSPLTKDLPTLEKINLMLGQTMGQDFEQNLKLKSSLAKAQSGQKLAPDEENDLIKAGLIQ